MSTRKEAVRSNKEALRLRLLTAALALPLFCALFGQAAADE
jgi:hypothetical protein